MADKKKEKMVKIYDPAIDAYRDVPLSLAKKQLEQLKELEKAIKGVEKS